MTARLVLSWFWGDVVFEFLPIGLWIFTRYMADTVWKPEPF